MANHCHIVWYRNDILIKFAAFNVIVTTVDLLFICFFIFYLLAKQKVETSIATTPHHDLWDEYFYK